MLALFHILHNTDDRVHLFVTLLDVSYYNGEMIYIVYKSCTLDSLLRVNVSCNYADCMERNIFRINGLLCTYVRKNECDYYHHAIFLQNNK